LEGAVVTSSGIVVLVVIALIVAYAVARTRQRLGLLVTGRTWIAVIAGTVVVLLALWVAKTH
jgi:hypothetical protein